MSDFEFTYIIYPFKKEILLLPQNRYIPSSPYANRDECLFGISLTDEKQPFRGNSLYQSLLL